MALIKIEHDNPIYDGMSLTFQAPCDCTEVNGIKIYYPSLTEGSTEIISAEFTFRDALNLDVTGIGNLFQEGAYVKVILDTTNNYAYIQNAANNAYLEKQISGIQSYGLSWHMYTGQRDLKYITENGVFLIPSNGAASDLPGDCVNGWLLNLRSSDVTENDTSVKQVFFRRGTPNTNSYETYTRVNLINGAEITAGNWERMLTSKDFVYSNGTLTITTT